jgi:hypothetical protein
MLPEVLLHAEMMFESATDPRVLERQRLLAEYEAELARRPGLARRLLAPRIYALGVWLARTGAYLAAEPQAKEYR